MKVFINYSENLHFTAKARHFEDIQIDEPKSFYGTNKGPSPVEYTLIGIGGCLASTFVHCLRKRNVEIEDLEISVDGKLKHSGPRMNLNLVSVDVELDLYLKDIEQSDLVDECINTFENYCIISKSLTQGIPISTNIRKKKKLKKKNSDENQ